MYACMQLLYCTSLLVFFYSEVLCWCCTVTKEQAQQATQTVSNNGTSRQLQETLLLQYISRVHVDTVYLLGHNVTWTELRLAQVNSKHAAGGGERLAHRGPVAR